MKTVIFYFVLSVLMLLPGMDELPPGPGEQNQSIPYLDDKVDYQRTIVYSPVFRAAWTQLREKVIGEDVKLATPTGLEHHLNARPYKPQPGQDWLIQAGFVGDGVIDRIEEEVKKRYGEEMNSLEQFRKEEDAIVCYARFRKYARFAHTFETLEWDFNTGEGPVRVSCFGISRNDGIEDKRNLRDQVTVFDYRNPGDFIVRLSTSEPGQEIILARINPEKTLLATVARVDERIGNSYGEPPGDMDELIIPKVTLSADHTYASLIGKFLKNEGFEEYFFASARQQTVFTMSESGVKAEATGEIVLHKGPGSRIYAFDEPFLVIVRQSFSTEPDFVAWICEPSVMVAAE